MSDHSRKLKIAIVVHGRFNAFDLAKALISRGHLVTVFTNYPKWATRRFKLSNSNVVSFCLHGYLVRCLAQIRRVIDRPLLTGFTHCLFGKWAAKSLRQQRWDMIYVFSGVAEEIIQMKKKGLYEGNPLIVMIRASSHILTQRQILTEEKKRTNFAIPLPEQWMVDRELREYESTDVVRVISGFCYHSFIEHGISEKKVKLILSGDPLGDFRPDEIVINERCASVFSGNPLRVVYVGTLSYRKGLWDLRDILRRLSSSMRFKLIGPGSPGELAILNDVLKDVEYVGKVAQTEISKHLNKSDIFIFPTLEEGYAQVIAQAMANGLPVLTTTNSQGPDVIECGQNGWILPIRNAEAFIEQLMWCDNHRVELANLIRVSYERKKIRTFDDVAKDLEKLAIRFNI